MCWDRPAAQCRHPEEHRVSGRYVQQQDGTWSRIGDANCNVFDVYVPEGGYFSENLETFVESRAHKRKLMKARNLKEKQRLTRREI